MINREKNQQQKILITNHLQINMKQPDPKLHQQMSFIKSGLRIAGYIAIPFTIEMAVVLLVISEVVGIIEELV